MGLDMYLNRKTYVGSHKDEPTIQITSKQHKFDPNKVQYIIEEIGYWRKANAIHNWFVRNVQDGEDDCKAYEVSKEDLERLLATVNEVLNASKLIDGEIVNGYQWDKEGNKEPIIEKGKLIEDSKMAEALLPTGSGFFFGSTAYDQYYYNDLVETKKIIEAVLADTDMMTEYEYRASW